MFEETKVVGADVPTGVQVPKTDTYKTRYDEAVKSGNSREAIKIKLEAHQNGEQV